MEHKSALGALCRVCGHRLSPSSKSEWSCSVRTKSESIQSTFGINIHQDDGDIHPIKLCKSCDAAVYKGKTSIREQITWQPHAEEGQCQTCQLYRSQSKGGRPKKAQKRSYNNYRHTLDQAEKARTINAACDILLTNSLSIRDIDHNKLGKVATKVVKDIMQATQSTLIQLPTGGPKLSICKTVHPRVGSEDASERTLRGRNKDIDHSISQISGGHGKFQMKHYMNSRRDLQKFITKIRIPTGHELALKATMGWSWMELRKLKRWLKKYKVFLACEQSTRTTMNHLRSRMDTNLQSIMAPFFFKDESGETICKEAPLVFIPNLKTNIKATLDELDRHNLLIWEDMKPNRIGIKFGADYGGGSTKSYYQIINVSKTNSRNMTTVFNVYEAGESEANLHIALDRHIDQINDLQEETWRGMPLDITMCGDYEVLRKFLGLQGASATYPCTYCEVKKENINTDMVSTPRTITGIKQDYQKVEADGCTARAKRENHSVCGKPFFNIPVDMICPPSLHISLGIWQKLYDLLVRDVQELGEAIVDDLADKGMPSTYQDAKFERYTQAIKKINSDIRSKREKADDLRRQAVDLEYQLITQSLVSPVDPVDEQLEEVKDLYNQANKLEKAADAERKKHHLSEQDNPLLKRLDKTLQNFKVRRQAYFSQIFNGNHVDKCLKQENYTQLLESVVQEAANLNSNPDIQDMAVRIQMKFMVVFEDFGKCHNMYSTAKSVTREEIDVLETNINSFITNFQDKFPKVTLTPKMHILWRHVTDFMRQMGFALGKYSEQGGEQLHHKFNTLRRRLEGIRNTRGQDPNLKLLLSMVEEHLITSHPEIRQEE